ncbi:MAG TPA: Sec-independent protein translocase subunit TatA [Pseudonocardiaceae bacterium]|nr:Sec-independent protein translocase subunit TatA [Pseudonocardiaceae bacterium]
MLNGFGWPHLLIIAVLIILLFGAKRLPDAARGIGKSMRIFKAETRGLQDDDAAAAGTAPAAQQPQQQLAPPQQQYTSAPFPTPTTADQGNGPTDQQR